MRRRETLMSDVAIVLIVGTLFTDCKKILSLVDRRASGPGRYLDCMKTRMG